MNIRSAIDQLLAYRREEYDDNDDMAHLEDAIDGMAIDLLTLVCSNLAYALAGARGKPEPQSCAMRARITEYATDIAAILDVWRLTDIEIVDGPGLLGLAPRPVYN